ncbi:Tyrosine recombinase domain protein (plasmid) [Coxiella burnetii str. Namibia]|nr:Tyrosine recombinase domain protein [Coxiella burnetii str. Namibia]
MLYRHVAQTDRFEATRLLSLKKKVSSQNKDKV